MSATMSIEQARSEYRSILATVPAADRAEVGTMARDFAYEVADGEDVEPSHWIEGLRRAISQLAWDRMTPAQRAAQKRAWDKADRESAAQALRAARGW